MSFFFIAHPLLLQQRINPHQPAISVASANQIVTVAIYDYISFFCNVKRCSNPNITEAFSVLKD
jgi:hypothetical protein